MKSPKENPNDIVKRAESGVRFVLYDLTWIEIPGGKEVAHDHEAGKLVFFFETLHYHKHIDDCR